MISAASASGRATRFIVGLLICLTQSGRAQDVPEPAAPPEVDVPATVTVVKVRTVAPKRSPWGEALFEHLRGIELASKDAGGKPRLAFKVEWSSPGEDKAIKACQSGKTGGVTVTLGALAGVVPELAAIELPYLFEDYAAADRGLERARPLLSELLAEQGFVFALRSESGFLHWASRRAPLLRPDDLAGQLLRAPGSPALYALAVNAKGVAGDAVRRALAAGELDGVESSLLFARLAKWSEHLRHITLSGHAYQAAGLVWCQPFLATLAPELAALVVADDPQRAARERAGLTLVRRFNDELVPRQYARAGITLHALDTDARATFVQRLTRARAAFEEAASERGKKLLSLLVGR